MSDYCNCCSTNREHIAQHYDPAALMGPNDDAETLLGQFREMFAGEGKCELTLADVEAYLKTLDTAKV